MKFEQILTLNNLPSVGIKTTRSIVEHTLKNKIDITDLVQLNEYLNFLSEKQEVKRLSKFSIVDIKNASIKAQEIIEKSISNGINMLSQFDVEFPQQLINIISNGKDVSPLFLYYKGDIDILRKYDGIAIIGTREPTTEGVEAGRYYGENFSKNNFNIVSGLALGCDTSAHEGALKANGKTTAILAHGLNIIYPKQNKFLASEIINNGGLLLSEYPIGTPPLPNYFVERDRLQSGLAKATIVVQTGIKGGTMHAVRATLENKKPLLVVNYKDQNIRSNEKVLGNYKLINEGAFPLREIEEGLKFINDYYNSTKNETSSYKLITHKEETKVIKNNQQKLDFD